MLKDMKTLTHRNPGQKGTKRLVEKYGKALVCMRYRYDEQNGERIKTVELIVERKKVLPPRGKELRDADVVPVEVKYREKLLREKIKQYGGTWDAQDKVWLVPYGQIKGTEFEQLIRKDLIRTLYKEPTRTVQQVVGRLKI